MSEKSCVCGCSTEARTETTDGCTCGCGGSAEQEPKEEAVAQR